MKPKNIDNEKFIFDRLQKKDKKEEKKLKND
jgi:hypothetical protein